jgi:hypothetical protein
MLTRLIRVAGVGKQENPRLGCSFPDGAASVP